MEGRHPVAGGGFGDIWKGSFGEAGQVVCLKVCKMYLMSDVKRLLKDYVREAIVWRQLKHPNVLPCLGLYYLDDTQERLCLVSPWMENGNLMEFLRAHSENVDRFQLMYDIASGLAYLHASKIVHGDLKGVNILMTPFHHACIADFGLSRISDSQLLRVTSSVSRVQGTARWCAPEVLMGSESSAESDIYAYASTCYEIITGLQPFYELRNDAAVTLAIHQGKHPTKPQHNVDDGVWLLMVNCWDNDPKSRPCAEEVLKHLVEVNPTARITAAESWEDELFTRMQGNIDQSRQQVEPVSGFLAALMLKHGMTGMPTTMLNLGRVTGSKAERMPAWKWDSGLKYDTVFDRQTVSVSNPIQDVEHGISVAPSVEEPLLNLPNLPLSYPSTASGTALILPQVVADTTQAQGTRFVSSKPTDILSNDNQAVQGPVLIYNYLAQGPPNYIPWIEQSNLKPEVISLSWLLCCQDDIPLRKRAPATAHLRWVFDIAFPPDPQPHNDSRGSGAQLWDISHQAYLSPSSAHNYFRAPASTHCILTKMHLIVSAYSEWSTILECRREKGGIQCIDVLHAIYSLLQVPLTNDELAMIPLEAMQYCKDARDARGFEA
ncbi:TKL/TKL-ccinproteinkinase [Moniliophthora roreri MCA 2997]|uniref:TKL/TKL-ccinproteinkinase n=1 Tax=Moniliophthora roreri (strain MCA 2997) TaxID=1381753 RepID=V2WYC3_MONRO|nr:TKL/TKL-ccinproteinkinase [Moniliophthora roreri MCA 2997]